MSAEKERLEKSERSLYFVANASTSRRHCSNPSAERLLILPRYFLSNWSASTVVSVMTCSILGSEIPLKSSVRFHVTCCALTLSASSILVPAELFWISVGDFAGYNFE